MSLFVKNTVLGLQNQDVDTQRISLFFTDFKNVFKKNAVSVDY